MFIPWRNFPSAVSNQYSELNTFIKIKILFPDGKGPDFYRDAFGSSWQQQPDLWLLTLSAFSLHNSPLGWDAAAALLPSPELRRWLHSHGDVALALGQQQELKIFIIWHLPIFCPS